MPTSGGPTSYNLDAQVSPVIRKERDASESPEILGNEAALKKLEPRTFLSPKEARGQLAIDSCDLLDWLGFGELYTKAISCAVTYGCGGCAGIVGVCVGCR